jgi:hypothetical protein
MDDLVLDVPADLGTDKNAQHDAAAQQGSTTAGDASEEDVSMASSATSSSIQQQRGKVKHMVLQILQRHQQRSQRMHYQQQ